MNKTTFKLALQISNLYQEMKPREGYDLSKHVDNSQKYDDLVDVLVELTEGKEDAFWTDPILCDDYTALTGRVCSNISYNDLCERYGNLAFGD